MDGDTTVYAYDANGNTQSRTSSEAPAEALEFHYDARDQMTRVTRGPPGGGQEVGRYAYNADGLRTRAESPTEDAARQAVDYYYDQSSVLEERKTGTSDLISRYHYGPLGALAQDDYSAGIPKRNFYHNDGLGTPTHLTDANDPNDPDRRSFSSSPIRPRSNDAARRSFFESALRLRVRSLRI